LKNNDEDEGSRQKLMFYYYSRISYRTYDVACTPRSPVGSVVFWSHVNSKSMYLVCWNIYAVLRGTFR
jgi:hypothetical protein